MLSLYVLFWIMVGLFAILGSVRGWTKEVVAASGLVLSLFAIDQLGYIVLSALGWVPENMGIDVAARRQFYIFTTFHLVITFFSYQGPRLGSLGQRLRPRDSLQDKLLGMIFGGINGYLIAGTVWSFLEFQAVNRSDWVRYQPGMPGIYPFDPLMLVRPDAASQAYNFVSYMPIPLLAPYLLIILIIVFLFVIIVLI
jgi:uncharacterized membrane protein required for colicin V production